MARFLNIAKENFTPRLVNLDNVQQVRTGQDNAGEEVVILDMIESVIHTGVDMGTFMLRLRTAIIEV